MPLRAVLVDTGPLLALADPSDQYHDRAHETLGRLASTDRGLLFSYPVVSETYTLLLRHLKPAFAQRWLGAIETGASLVNPTDRDYLDAIRLLRRYGDQAISLVDATLAILSKRLELPVWTFDRDFDVLRVEVWR